MTSKRLSVAMSAVHRVLARLRQARSGAAAVEFAIIVPLMLAFYFLTMEFSQGIETSRKVGRVASLVGDLVSQSPTMTEDELEAIMEIGEAVLQPYNRSRPEITVTAIQISDDENEVPSVVWSRRFSNGNMSEPETPGAQTRVPPDLVSPGAFLIRSETTLPYQPVITWSETGKQALGLTAAFDQINMGERYYIHPRVSRTIPCNDC